MCLIAAKYYMEEHCMELNFMHTVLINHYFLKLLWNVTMAFLDNLFSFSFDVCLQDPTEEHSE